MMQFKKGQRVKFLNEKGGGIIAKIEGNIVYVTIEDGFDIPVKMQDIIPAQANTTAEALFTHEHEKESASTFSADDQEIEEEAQSNEAISSIDNHPAFPKAEEGIYLAFVPQNQNHILTAPLDLYLINNTKLELLYNVLLQQQDSYLGYDYGNVYAHSKLYLATVSRENLNEWAEGLVQILFHQSRSEFYYHSLDAEFKIRMHKLMQNETAYSELNLMGEKAYYHQLISLAAIPKKEVTDKKSKPEQDKTEVSIGIKTNPFAKFPQKEGVYEIDLHAEKIIPHAEKYAPESIMQKQLAYFRVIIEQAIAANVKDLVFIHGVGVGRLKYEMKKILHDYEDNLSYEDASILQYGVGATKVKIF
jgi:hypothetical protein